MSALISFEVFARPALRAAMGFRPPTREIMTGTLTSAVDSRHGVHQFRLAVAGPKETLTPFSAHQGHFLSVAARSSRLLEIAPDVTHLPAGSRCAAWSLS